ncbi:hypothetical protein Pint_31897 [Pistacia integerrima]|uniref:Uncharacterized protein n=1 Tax=Pistacia integerrima TaxID=434235 RepID=A0ACC0XPX5_9ROSI|nr:hypothetical protein Pint_31897 [Pistacia integerrima]
MDLRFSATLNPKLRKKQSFSFDFKNTSFRILATACLSPLKTQKPALSFLFCSSLLGFLLVKKRSLGKSGTVIFNKWLSLLSLDLRPPFLFHAPPTSLIPPPIVSRSDCRPLFLPSSFRTSVWLLLTELSLESQLPRVFNPSKPLLQSCHP